MGVGGYHVKKQVPLVRMINKGSYLTNLLPGITIITCFRIATQHNTEERGVIAKSFIRKRKQDGDYDYGAGLELVQNHGNWGEVNEHWGGRKISPFR